MSFGEECSACERKRAGDLQSVVPLCFIRIEQKMSSGKLASRGLVSQPLSAELVIGTELRGDLAPLHCVWLLYFSLL